MTHDPLCSLSKPCDDEIPEHGYCSMQHGMFCIHCHQWCICEVLGEKYAAALRDAIAAANDVWENGKVDSEKGVWYVVQAIEDLGGER